MLSKDQKLLLSPYYQLYDIIVPQDNFYRLVDGLIDFDFIREELKDKYSPDMGREAEDPVRLFKYLFIKMKEDLPDRNLVDRSLTDMSLKRFLGYMPEDKVIDAATLSVFRRQRLTDIDLLDKLLGKTVGLAMELGLIKSKTIIVDGTHTSSLYRSMNPREALGKRRRSLVETALKLVPELKENHHYRTTYSRGIQSMTLQAAMALFVVNIKRIMALKGNDEGK